MLNKEVIQRVQSLYSKGVQSDDSRLSNRHIYNKLRTLRSKHVSQEIKKNQSVSQWSYQTLPCIELVEVPLNECPCEVQSGCTILRSKYPIPSPMVGMSDHIIQSITALEGRLSFTKTSWTNKKFKNGNKFTKVNPDYFFRDQYLYVTVTLILETITLTGLFNDPIEAAKFPNACKVFNECTNYLELEFPMEEDLMDGLIEEAARELIGLFNSSREDKSNNGQDTDINESK